MQALVADQPSGTLLLLWLSLGLIPYGIHISTRHRATRLRLYKVYFLLLKVLFCILALTTAYVHYHSILVLFFLVLILPALSVVERIGMRLLMHNL